MSDQGLLPCPFCGGAAEMFTDIDSRIEPLVYGTSLNVDVFTNNEYFGVRCPKCDIAMTNPFIEPHYAIAAWNTRTPPTTGDNPVPISNIKDKTYGN